MSDFPVYYNRFHLTAFKVVLLKASSDIPNSPYCTFLPEGRAHLQIRVLLPLLEYSDCLLQPITLDSIACYGPAGSLRMFESRKPYRGCILKDIIGGCGRRGTLGCSNQIEREVQHSADSRAGWGGHRHAHDARTGSWVKQLARETVHVS
jgi:hypothetical protein